MSATTAPILFPTLTGMVDLAHVDPVSITIEAISHGLAQINRYSGALELPLSVAQHSVLVLEIFKQLYPHYRSQGIHALLHDGHEYLIGDITTPTVRLLTRTYPAFGAILDLEKARIDDAIRTRFDLMKPEPLLAEAIHRADQIALATEWHRLMPSDCGSCPVDEQPMKSVSRIKPLGWAAADIEFTTAFRMEMAIYTSQRTA